MRRRILIATAVVGLLLLALGVRLAQPMARPALGFVSKVVCSDVFVGGFTPEQALADLPDEPIAKLVRTRVDTVRRVVTASVPLIARRSAAYREGSGCTIGAPATASATRLISPVSSPADDMSVNRAMEGVDYAALDAALDDAFAEPDSFGPRRTRAVVVLRDGEIIAERYAPGFDARSRFTGWSMTKSVTAALVGILVGEGVLDLQARALHPAWRNTDDPRRDISLHDLLQMSSGLDFDESYAPTGAATRMLFDSNDAARLAAQSPLAAQPGTRFSYSSATTNIISAIIRDVLGNDETYHAFPHRALFDRIGMHSALMETDPAGTIIGSSFMYATARDWARFGQLFLNDGVWRGERVLPQGWVEYSTTPAPAARIGQYGAHWWLNAGAPGDSTRRLWPKLPRDAYAATGFQGQYVLILPTQSLVIVRLGVTADDRAFAINELAYQIVQAMGRN